MKASFVRNKHTRDVKHNFTQDEAQKNIKNYDKQRQNATESEKKWKRDFLEKKET